MSRKRSRVHFEVPQDTCDCHTHIFGEAQRFPFAPFLEIDDGRVFNQLAIWAPDPALRQAILVENPARLYGF